MSDWNQKQGQGQQGTQNQPYQGQQGGGSHGGGQGGSGQGGSGQGGSGQGGGKGGSGQGGKAQGEQGAWVWLKWNENAPQDAWKEWGNELKGWHAESGEWNCKIWVPANSQAEAEKFVQNKIRSSKWVKDTKFEWNWNKWAA